MQSNIAFKCSLAMKAVAYTRINRYELAEQTLKKMRNQDEDNCLTHLT